MPLLQRKRVGAAAVEATSGTAESLAAGDAAFDIYDLRISESFSVEKREAQASFDRLNSVVGAQSATITFKTDMAWDGTSTVPTWASVLLPGCGYVNSSGTFTPRSEAPGSNVKTLTVGVYNDGKLETIYGASGTARIVLPAGKMCYIEWTFTGSYGGESDTALLSPTYPTASPIKFTSATVTHNSVDQKVAEAALDFGNNVVLREDASDASGYCGAIITDREPMFSLNPEAVLVATQDRTGIWQAGTEYAISVVLDGPTNSDITLTIPKAQIHNMQEGNREKIVTDEIEFSCNKNATTNDEQVSIVFNEAS